MGNAPPAAAPAPVTGDGDSSSVESSPSTGGGLARSAGLLAAGSLASRLFGLLREVMIAALFGASGPVSAFRVAAQLPTLIYDFLIGGMLSAALVPVLSEYAGKGRAEFARLASSLLTFFTLILALLVIVLELTAGGLADLLAGGFRTGDPALFDLTVTLMRVTAPLLLFFCLAGLLTAILYSLQRFAFPALATAVFNLGIIVTAPFLAPVIGVMALAVGLLIGALAQILVLTIDVRRAGVWLRLTRDWRHPALRKIGRLYLPIAGGMVVSLVQVGLDRRLASGTGEQSIAWMANATTLQQLPLGLTSVAIAMAALPQLSRLFVAGDEEGFRTTLGRGLRLVWLLVLPAALILWGWGEPIIRLLFQRGAFTAADTLAVNQALRIYLWGMLFAAMDFPLNFAFYARNNTLLPALVGVASVVCYAIIAWLLVESLGFLGLVWADTAKQASIMLLLVQWRIGGLAAATWRALAKMTAAGALTALPVWWLSPRLAGGDGPWSDVLAVITGAVVVVLVSIALLWVLRVDDGREIAERLLRRFQRGERPV
jgi:putative peptidoglycan lipid II flippase